MKLPDQMDVGKSRPSGASTIGVGSHLSAESGTAVAASVGVASGESGPGADGEATVGTRESSNSSSISSHHVSQATFLIA